MVYSKGLEMNRRHAVPILLAMLAVLAACVSRPDPAIQVLAPSRFNLVIVIDGLRPDYITPRLMPHLHALGERGVFGEMHSTAFPSVTRVNSATIGTGSYPSSHGIVGNTMLVREIFDDAFSTGSARTLRRLAGRSGGSLLGTPSLGELLDERGMRLFVTGSAGSGTSLLLGPEPRAGVSIWTAGGFFVPAAAGTEAIAAVGSLADDNPGRTVWAFDAWLHKALGDEPPDATILWINEPDGATHRHGVGAPATLKAVANVDQQIGRIVAALARHGLSDRVNIFVTSDHGFSTNAGRFNAARVLRENEIDDDALAIVGNMIYLARDDPKLLARVVTALQRDPEAGNIYTRPASPGSSQGVEPGTLSTGVIQWDHERAADVLVSPRWSDEINRFGFAGAIARGGRHTASHGSDSPYDLQIRLVAAGPDIKRRVRSKVPTGNVDLAPTVLHLLGIESPPGMDGRILRELLREDHGSADITVHERTHRAAVTLEDGLRYEAQLDTIEVGSTVYLRGARTHRSQASAP
jgi:arylsulfatase A-like enzyme